MGVACGFVRLDVDGRRMKDGRRHDGKNLILVWVTVAVVMIWYRGWNVGSRFVESDGLRSEVKVWWKEQNDSCIWRSDDACCWTR